ncbi:MAG: hypothetical protein K6D94_12315 [Clostridiales bacterium]|nr:hypothetical protein [Clostridiales bacterium]
MILTPMQTTVCYRCPECGGMVISPVGAFSLKGDMFRLRCPCGQSAMTVRQNGDTVRITVPCVTCGRDHMYTLGKSVFYGRDLFILSCGLSGADTVILGERDKVISAYHESTKRLASIIGVDPADIDFSDDEARTAMHPEAGGDEPDEIWEDEEYAPMRREPENAGFETAVRTSLAILADEGRIKCLCSDKANQDIVYDFTDRGVAVECASCGARKEIVLTGEAAAERLAEEDMIVLDE